MTTNLEDNLEIDILSDGVCSMMDKLFFQATDGKTIDYAWDAPQPACVNPLSKREAAEWGPAAMTVTFNRVAHEPRRLGSRRVSLIPGFSQRSSAEPFYGYRSDPPKAKAFDVTDPSGPVAKAVKAAGELAALAEHNGEDEEPIWKMLEGSFGIKLTMQRQLVKPDLSMTSPKDEIKFVRSPNHMLFGFNSAAPSVTPNTGKYRPETMIENLMFDWHAMALSLRFIGEMIYRYDYREISVGTQIAFAPAFVEGREFTRPTYSSNIVPVSAPLKSNVLSEAVDATMKYFEGSFARRNVAMAIRSESRALTISVDTPISVERLRDLAAKQHSVAIRLRSNVTKPLEVPIVADINELAKPRFRETVIQSATRLKMATIPSWNRVSRMVLSSLFIKGFKGKDQLVAAMRKKKILSALNIEQTYQLLKSIAVNLPKGIGFAIYCILERLLPTKDDAQIEFCLMIQRFSGADTVTLLTSYDEALVAAVADSSDAEKVLNWLQTSYNCQTAHIHGVTQIINALKPNEDVAEAFKTAIFNYVTKRMRYWADFYSSVVVDCRNSLAALREEAKERDLTKKAGSHVDLTDTIEISTTSFASWTDDQVREAILSAKVKMIKSNFSSAAYRHATINVADTMKVSVFVSSSQYNKIMLKQADSYARKRATWGAKLAAAATDWESKRRKFTSFTRVTDMAEYLDNQFTPDVSWIALVADVEEKFRITERSMTNMLKKNLGTTPDLSNTPEDEEAEEVAASDQKWMLGNPYASLNFFDSDSSQSVDSNPEASDTDSIASNEEKPSTILDKMSTKMTLTDIDLFDALGLTDEVEGPTVAYDPSGYSLRDYLQSSPSFPYKADAYRHFLEAKHNKAVDYHGTLKEVEKEAEAFRSEYSKFSMKDSSSSFVLEDENGYDIV